MMYRCDGFRPLRQTVEVYSSGVAARIFAGRLARRIYGKRGVCANCRENLRTENGRWVQFQVFIGLPQPRGGVSGKDEWLEVTIT
jgi:hypothetical protein